MSEPYHYEPLNEGEIRLLSVSLDEGEPYGLALSLRHVVLDDAKDKYTALSYTWGRPEPLRDGSTHQPNNTWKLNCDDGVIEVRQNLFDFFREMRLKGSDMSPLWIDAVCINQKDNDEKSEQVLRMGQIYASSLHVWIWLGSRPITSEVRQIIDEFIPAILEDYKHRNRDPQIYRSIDILDEKSSDPIIQKIGYDKWALWKTWWQQYRALFARSWFKRGWTVQEATLQAPERCSILVGPDVIPWNLLLDFSSFLDHVRWDLMLDQKPEYGTFSPLYNRLQVCRDFHTRKSKAAQTGFDATTLKQQWHADYLDLVIRMNDLSSEDTRDKIYAYLGIMLQSKPSWIGNSIVPDYTVDDVLVYRNFATVMLQNAPGLRVLELTHGRQGEANPKLPSWVPDFSNLPRGSSRRIYNASERRRDGMNIPAIRGNYLTFCGAQFTSISSLDVLENVSTDAKDRLAAFSLLPGKYAGSGQCMPEAIWETALHSAWHLFDTEHRPLRARVRRWLLQRLWNLWHQGAEQESLSTLLAPVADDDNLMKWLPTLKEVKVPDAPSRDDDFDGLLETALLQREIYYMTSGYFGIGPRSLCLGDQVWILEGGDVPFVLRQNEDGETYTLLGYMEVHGIMHGEAMTDEFRSRFGPVTIV